MIRKARPSDLDSIVDIYDAIFRREEKSGQRYTNWQRGLYPTRDTARKAGKAGTLYVDERGGDIAAAVNLNQIQPREYGDIPWTIPAKPEEVAVIHTLCVSPRWAGRGKGRQLVEFCEAEGRRMGAKVMRLDTYVGNAPANAMYPRLGYTLAGKTLFHFQNFIWEELNCYEKAL